MCVCGTWPHVVCIHKAHFLSSSCSVVSWANYHQIQILTKYTGTTCVVSCKGKVAFQGQLESRGWEMGKQKQKIVQKVSCAETRQLEAQTLLLPTQSSMGILFMNLEVFSEDIPSTVLRYNCGSKRPWGVSVSCFASHVLSSAWFAWCLVFVFLQGWDVGTLGNTLSGCITQDPREGPGPSQACAIHPTHPVRLVACISEAYCCARRLVHKIDKWRAEKPVGQPKINY